MTSVWLLVILAALASGCECLVCSSVSHNRKKRVISGSPLLARRATGYDAVLYYVWIGRAAHCSDSEKIKQFFIGKKCKVTKEDLICGGSLISPTLVQTAAHCLTKLNGRREKGWTYSNRDSHWESIMEVHCCNNNVASFTSGRKSRKYVVHQKYAVDSTSMLTTHDYGWVILSSAVALSEQSDFAPLYSLSTMAMLYTNTISLQSMCLIIGFGRYIENSTQLSDVLRHSWLSAMDYGTTLFIIKKRWYAGKNLPFQYADYATWVSLRSYNKMYYASSGGDSGGPVTCNNFNAAIILGDWWFTRTGADIRNRVPYYYVQFGVSSALAFLVFEQSAEYRRPFLKSIDEYNSFQLFPTFVPDHLSSLASS